MHTHNKYIYCCKTHNSMFVVIMLLCDITENNVRRTLYACVILHVMYDPIYHTPYTYTDVPGDTSYVLWDTPITIEIEY